MAADLPTRKAPFDAPAPSTIGWSGFHIGGFAGGSLADAQGGYAISSATLAALPPIIPVIDASGSRDLRLNGADVGIEAGYDWRVARQFVIGVDADLNWSGLRGSQVSTGLIPNFGVPYTITQSMSVDWESSLRLRAGFLPRDDLLLYATGGLALARLRYSTAFWDPVPEIESTSFSAIRPGFVLGTGAEWAMSAKWSLQSEYRYSQFSAASGTGSGLLSDGSTAFIAHSTGTLRENSLRFGVKYHFE